MQQNISISCIVHLVPKRSSSVCMLMCAVSFMVNGVALLHVQWQVCGIISYILFLADIAVPQEEGHTL